MSVLNKMPRPPTRKTGPINLARKCDRSMVMSPLNGSRARSRHITLEGDKAAEREQDDTRADEESAGRDDAAPDENGEVGRENAEHADAVHEPPDGRNQAAPVARPEVMHVEDIKAGEQRQDPRKIDEG